MLTQSTHTPSQSSLSVKEAEKFLAASPLWELKDDAISRVFRFKDFREAIGFVNRLAAVANEMDHHPEISISYNEVRIECSTHKVGGLSSLDFTLAERIDRLVFAS